MALRRKALFLLPSDRMGGAERVVRTTAIAAARSGDFDLIELFILCWSRSGTLDELEALANVRLHYTLAGDERGGVVPMIRFLMRSRYSFVFSSSTHINALCSLLRTLGLLRADRLVTRESTVIFEREFGWVGILFRAMYRLYGAQDIIVCQTARMRNSLDQHTQGRFSRLLRVLPNPMDLERISSGQLMSPPAAVASIPASRIKIGWCGRLSRVKDPILAVETLRALHDLGKSEMHLIMIGDGPERKAVEECAQRLSVAEFVTLVGHQDNPTASLAQCDIGLITSETEGFPNVVLEMLASGVRGIVSTDCAGDLSTLPRVNVVRSREQTALARELALSLPFKDRSDVDALIRDRDPNAFLATLLKASL